MAHNCATDVNFKHVREDVVVGTLHVLAGRGVTQARACIVNFDVDFTGVSQGPSQGPSNSHKNHNIRT